MKEDILLKLYDYCGKKYSKKEMTDYLNKLGEKIPYHLEGIDQDNFIRNFMDWFVLERIIPETGKLLTDSYVKEHPELDEKTKQKILNTKNIIASEFVVIAKEGLNLKLKNRENGNYYPVTQVSNNPQIQANTIILGRIFPWGEIYRFAGVMALAYTPMILDSDIMKHHYEKKEIERAENILLSQSAKLTAILNKYPFQWVDGICEVLSIETGGRKNEKAKNIADKLIGEIATGHKVIQDSINPQRCKRANRKAKSELLMDKEELYNKRAGLYENGRYAEALEALSEAHRKDPEDVDTIVLLAGCYINIAHFTEAARLLLDADKLDPSNPMIKYNLGYALLCMGRVNDAMRCMKKCLRLNPEAEIKKMAKRMIKSEEHFTEKLENNYEIPLEEEFECEEKFLLAQKHLYNKQLEEAIALYEWILEKKPDFHRAIQNIGVCYIQGGKLKESLKYFERALSISPNDDLCLGNFAHAYYLLGDYEKSQEYSEKSMKYVNEPLLRDLFRLITLFIEIEQFEFARELLSKYGSTHDNAQLTFLSGVLYAKQREYLAAKEEFQSIRKYSKTAMEYFEKAKALSDGKIKDYNFEAKIAFNLSEDML